MPCDNPTGDRHDIPTDGRRLDVGFKINWGDDDIRDQWQGSYGFCSFQCLADWASQRAADHDQHVLKDGA